MSPPHPCQAIVNTVTHHPRVEYSTPPNPTHPSLRKHSKFKMTPSPPLSSNCLYCYSSLQGGVLYPTKPNLPISEGAFLVQKDPSPPLSVQTFLTSSTTFVTVTSSCSSFSVSAFSSSLARRPNPLGGVGFLFRAGPSAKIQTIFLRAKQDKK